MYISRRAHGCISAEEFMDVYQQKSSRMYIIRKTHSRIIAVIIAVIIVAIRQIYMQLLFSSCYNGSSVVGIQ